MFYQKLNSAVCLVFACLWIISEAKFNEEQQAMIDNLHNECVGQTGAAEGLITNAQKGDFADDANLKCYIKCVFDEIGMIDDNGQLDIEGMVAMLPDELKVAAEPVFRKCGTKPGSDLCDSMWNTHKCYYAENPSAYFLP